MTTRQIPTEAEVIGYMASLSNWGRWEFMFMVAPLRFYNATGSPVNPLAIF